MAGHSAAEVSRRAARGGSNRQNRQNRPPEGGRKVTIRMTLTAPGCGVAPMILDDVRERVAKVPGVGAVDVDLVFDPPWTPEKMSEAARLQLGFW